jgi:hypothetical protein
MTNETNETNVQTFPVLSIDAWGNETDGYEWNQWFNVGSIDLDLDAETATSSALWSMRAINERGP